MSEKKFTVRPEVEINLSQQDIDDIMSSALDSGICHWCRRAEVVGEYLGEYASDQISRGGSLILHDIESAQTWELTLEKFLNGVRLLFDGGCSISITNNCIDTCEIDSADADIIVQFAIFGEVVFG